MSADDRVENIERIMEIPDWGIDLSPADRPGVPKETAPHAVPHAHWIEPDRQRATVTVLKRALLDELTPVFSTAVPPRGLSGLLRGVAYEIPENRVRHWLILRLADQIDVVEGLL